MLVVAVDHTVVDSSIQVDRVEPEQMAEADVVDVVVAVEPVKVDCSVPMVLAPVVAVVVAVAKVVPVEPVALVAVLP